MIDEQDLAAAVRAGGRWPTAASRSSIRTALSSEVDLEHVAESNVPRRPCDGRHPGRLVALAGLATAAAAIATVVAVRDDGEREAGPATTATVASDRVEEKPSIDDLAGRRWLLVAQDGMVVATPTVPTLEFAADGRSIEGTAGCVTFDIPGDFEDGVVRSSSTTIGSRCLRRGDNSVHFGTSSIPHDGDRIVLVAGGSRLRLVAPDGTPHLDYLRWDDLPVADALDLIGPQRLDPEDGEVVRFSPDNTVALGDCSGTWTLGSWLTVRGLTSTAPGGCAVPAGEVVEEDVPVGADETRGLLQELLGGSRVEVRRAGVGAVYVGGDGPVLRLTRVEWTAGSPAIDAADGSVFGFRASQRVSPEAVRDVIERQLGDVDRDTGWVTAPSTPRSDGVVDCRAGRPYRELWWGDLRIGFTQEDSAVTAVVSSWSVGDPSASGSDRQRPDDVAPGAPELLTETGIDVGSTEAEVRAAYESQLIPFRQEGSVTMVLDGPVGDDLGSQMWFVVAGGVLTGIGVTPGFC